MKKRILFLITIIILSLISIKTTAAKTTSFYESDFISNIWMNKKNPQNGLTYYNQARFFKETSTNNIAYCIEPFIFFEGGHEYVGTASPKNYTQEQITNMTLISHFGYGYKNHTEPKWYAVTQFMLWKVAEPSGYYYFSEYKNGPEITMFEKEINEINALVNNFKRETSFNNQEYYLVENSIFEIEDENNVLESFIITSNNATIQNNRLITNKLSEGKHKIKLEKQSNIYNRPILFYQSETNQDILNTGDPISQINELTLNIIKTTVKVTKIDSETVSKIPQGEASLANTIFSLYTTTHEYLKDVTIGNDSTATIENLPFGTYYLKEKTPGKGYKLNTSNYYFTLTKEHPNQNVLIFNDVIKAKVQIKKEYGYTNNFLPEKNISFNIYDTNNRLIKTIMTNEEGIAEIDLPYGKYKLTQLTTTEGYAKIEPIYFEVLTDKTITYNLKDYKIPVPNTKTNSILHNLLTIIWNLICGRK